MKLIRTFRTMTSERFLVQKKEGQDSAAIDLHYLADGHVAGTVFLFEHAGIEDAEVPEFLRHIDEALLPWVSLEDRTLTFTVVRGHVVGDFSPTREMRERAADCQGTVVLSGENGDCDCDCICGSDSIRRTASCQSKRSRANPARCPTT